MSAPTPPRSADAASPAGDGPAATIDIGRALVVLAGSRSLEQAVPHLLEIIGGGLAWDLAALFVVEEEAERLRLVRGWAAEEAARRTFLDASSRITFRQGEGIPGRVWRTRQPAWIADLPDEPDYLRRAEAAAARLQTGLFLPVTSGEQVLGVLELYSEERRAPDNSVILGLEPFTNILGMFVERATAERRVRDWSDRLSAIVAASLDAMVFIDETGRLTGWNTQAERAFGWTADEAIGRPLSDMLVPPELRAAHREGMERYLRTRVPHVLGRRLEMPALHRDGRRLLVELSIVASETEGSTVFTGFLRDITDDREREAQHRSLARLPEEAPSPMLRVGTNGGVQYANRPASVLVRSGRVSPRRLRAAVEQALAEQKRTRLEIVVRGTTYSLEVVPFSDEGYANIYAIDISERVRADADRRRSETDIRALYDIASDPSLGSRARMRALLSLVGTRFGHGISALMRIVDDGLYVEEADVPGPGPAVGSVLRREETFGDEVIRRGDVLAITDTALDGWTSHPACRTWGLRAYVGVPVEVDGKVEGVLSFASPESRRDPFQPHDIAFLRLMARWIGGEWERDRVAMRLADANRELEEAVARSRELAIAADRASAAKSEFLAAMSHEIRTPLHGIVGSVEVLRGNSLDEQSRAFVDVLASSTDALIRVVDDILDLSRIEASELLLEHQPVDIRRLVLDVSALYEFAAVAKRLRLETSVADTVPDRVIADPTRLRQIIANLVANSVKFTVAGSISVHVEASPGGERSSARRMLRIAVTDTGVGMDETTALRAFDPFYQADASTSRLHGGTGLGLAIIRRLVDLMGGRVELSSTPGSGTTVVVELPVEVTAEGVAEAQPLPRLGGGPVTTPKPRTPPGPARPEPALVLVVDDDQVASLVLKTLLERRGHRVETIDNGAEALARMSAFEHDLVLLDCRLPGMDGFEVARRQRAQEARSSRPRIPIIATTADAYEQTRNECRAAGMDDRLAKPFRDRDLTVVLDRWLPNATRKQSADEGTGRLLGSRTSDAESIPDGALRETYVAAGAVRTLELVELFMDGLHQAETELTAALRNGSAVALLEGAHRLKGSAAAVGEHRLAELLAAIERGAREGRLPDPASMQAVTNEITGARVRMAALAARLLGPSTEDPE